MARWSSSASDSASELVDRPAASDDAAQAEAPLTWTLRPGFIAGSPWPRAAALILLGLPALVVLAWIAAWMGAMPALLLGAIALAVSLGAWTRQRRLQAMAPAATQGQVLSWQGLWPGQPARPAMRSKAGQKVLQPARPGTLAEEPAAGFQLGGETVWPRIRLQWGPHICLQCTDRHWAWLSLRDHPADRALRVLLRTLSAPAPDASPKASKVHAGSSPDAMASCEAWETAVARRRAQAEAEAHADEVRDDFPATAIMKYDTGTELEPRRSHG
ncbi:MAG: hypothetical protein RI920_867 [Pseudomonadota bacterium]|jgi:hypothetical protein